MIAASEPLGDNEITAVYEFYLTAAAAQ